MYASSMTDVEMVQCRKQHEPRPRGTTCRPCAREAQARWQAANPEAHRAKQREWREKNRDRRKEIEYASRLKTQYGLTIEDYQRMLAEQGGGCAICGQAAGSYRNQDFLCVDHNHETGQVRGLLCGSCNDGLGRFRDNPILLASAIAYLKTHDGDD